MFPTLSADNFGHMFRAGHRDALRHVLRLLRSDFVEADARQWIHERAQMVCRTVRLGDGRQRFRQPQHGEFEGELVGPVVANVRPI